VIRQGRDSRQGQNLQLGRMGKRADDCDRGILPNKANQFHIIGGNPIRQEGLSSRSKVSENAPGFVLTYRANFPSMIVLSKSNLLSFHSHFPCEVVGAHEGGSSIAA